MRAMDRLLAAIGVFAIVLLAAGAGTAAWLTYGYGTIELEVHSTAPGGDDVSIRLPGAVARIVTALMPRSARLEAGREIAEWLPVARAALSEFSRCPDAHLVHIRSRGDAVRISKRGKVLLAEVVSRHENVRVSIPIRVAEAMLDVLEDSARLSGAAPTN